MTSRNTIKPFIKWVGGKGHLLNIISAKYPSGLGKEIDTYIEPFVGGGAVLFDILSKYQLRQVIINDINPKLTNCYFAVKNEPSELIRLLEDYEKYYNKQGPELQSAFYYTKRKKFNEIDGNSVESAALLIFLNKTCFNGLYRENKNGSFNVPIGKYYTPCICDKRNIEACSEALKKVDILTGDYSQALLKTDSKTFIYFDPPYRPISLTAAFTSYHKSSIFDDSEQIRLAHEISKCINCGAKVLLSNSDPKSTNTEDDFFDDLYNGILIDRISVMRFINGRDKKEITELLISNY